MLRLSRTGAEDASLTAIRRGTCTPRARARGVGRPVFLFDVVLPPTTWNPIFVGPTMVSLLREYHASRCMKPMSVFSKYLRTRTARLGQNRSLKAMWNPRVSVTLATFNCDSGGRGDADLPQHCGTSTRHAPRKMSPGDSPELKKCPKVAQRSPNDRPRIARQLPDNCSGSRPNFRQVWSMAAKAPPASDTFG